MRNAIKAHAEELARSFKCSKEFICVKSRFETLCRAKDIGLQNNLVCLEQDCVACEFRMNSDIGQFCQCPIRVYIGKTLKI